jgi:hypothetical protein
VPMPPAPTSWTSPHSPASTPSRAPVRKRIGVLSRAPTRTPVGFDPADATPALEASNMSDERSRAWLSGRPINEIARKEPRERT